MPLRGHRPKAWLLLEENGKFRTRGLTAIEDVWNHVLEWYIGAVVPFSPHGFLEDMR